MFLATLIAVAGFVIKSSYNEHFVKRNALATASLPYHQVDI